MKGVLTYINYNLNRKKEPIITLFVRTEDGKRNKVQVTDFRPRFYLKESYNLQYYLEHLKGNFKFDKSDRKSIFGDTLYELIYINPKETENIRRNFYNLHLSADVRFVWVYLIETGIRAGIELIDNKVISADTTVQPKIGYIDIECAQERVSSTGKDPIICASVLNGYTDKIHTFFLISKKMDKKINGNEYLHIYENERDMLTAFQRHLKHEDFDIITGWYISNYDLRQLLNRLRVLKLTPFLDYYLTVAGDARFTEREVFDLDRGYRRLHLSDLPSYSLGYVARTELDKKKTEVGNKAIYLWENEPEELIRANREHVALEREIDVKCGILDHYWTLKNLVGCRLLDTNYASRIVDMLLLREAKRRNVVLPTRTKKEFPRYPGARVFCTPGLYENVDIFDYSTEYPSIIKQYNISPECKRMIGGEVTFSQDHKGIVPAVLDILIEQRRKVQRKMQGLTGKDKRRAFRKQEALKYSTNAIYGAFGYEASRLADRDCAAFVTEKGRELLVLVENYFKTKGNEVVAGDTDSIFVVGCEEPDIAVDGFNFYLNKILIEKTGKQSEIKLEHKKELSFKRILIKTKKHYAGLRPDGSLYVRGMGLVKSDTSKFISDIQRELLLMLLTKRTKRDIREYVWNVITKIRVGGYNWLDIARGTKMTKPIDKYDTNLPHVRAAKYSNEHLNTSFKAGDKIMWCYVKECETDVIAFDYGIDVPKRFVPDTNKIIADLRLKIEDIIKIVGLSFPEKQRVLSDYLDD